jgi:Protein of unknown function (DUF2490)
MLRIALAQSQDPAILVVLFCSVLFSGTAYGQNFQQWSEFDVAWSSRSIGFLAPFVVRFDPALPNPQLVAGELTVDVPVARHLTLTGGYLFADLPQRAQSHVHLPLIAVSTTFRAGPVRIADRNRLEKLIGFGVSPIRYRNRLLVDLPLGPDGRWHVFGDDEVFFDTSASQWNQNRLQLGTGARITSGVGLDLYYLQRRVSGGSSSTNVFGTTVRLTLKPSSGGSHQ